MGQYFIAVNQTKKEYVCPWEIGGLAKLWEWCANSQAGIFPYLLRKSDGLGGGDVEDPEAAKYAGRWAGDRIYLVGDYDSSKLYDRARKTYRSIAKKLVEEYNRFLGVKELKLKYGRPDMVVTGQGLEKEPVLELKTQEGERSSQ